MSTHQPDRLPGGSEDALRGLAEHAASTALPGDPSEVRRLGRRRQVRRRQLVGALTAVLVLALGAGTLVATLQDQGLTPSPPVASTSAAPSPAPPQERQVDADDTVQAADLPAPQADGSWADVEAAERAGVCQSGDWTDLGATSVATNGLQRRIPAPGETEQPLGQAVALQLPDADAAAQAAETIRGWVQGCPAELESQGLQVLDRPVTWTDAPVEGGSASFAEVVHAPAELDLANEGGFWESVGVTVVGDRVAVTVDVVGPQTEHQVSTDPDEAEATGMPLHPQFDLTAAAALRLADRVPPGPTTDDPSDQGGAPLTEAMVPQLEDFEWSDDVTFTGIENYTDEGQSTVIPCQQDRLSTLGPDDLQVVYVDGDVSASAAAMSFADEATAQQAWATLQEWADGCTDFLAGQEVEVLNEVQEIPVPVPTGEATFHTFATAAESPEEGQFNDVGMSRVDNRIVVAAMVEVAPDHNWDTEPGGPVGQTYPMIRTIQNLNQRLAG